MSENAAAIVLQWYGAIAGGDRGADRRLDLGRRPTGWAFVLFVTSSIAFILCGFLDPRPAEAIGARTSSCSPSTCSASTAI